jgi:hypothetical protein
MRNEARQREHRDNDDNWKGHDNPTEEGGAITTPPMTVTGNETAPAQPYERWISGGMGTTKTGPGGVVDVSWAVGKFFVLFSNIVFCY